MKKTKAFNVRDTDGGLWPDIQRIKKQMQKTAVVKLKDADVVRYLIQVGVVAHDTNVELAWIDKKGPR